MAHQVTRMNSYSTSLVSLPFRGQSSLQTSGSPSRECPDCEMIHGVTSLWPWLPSSDADTATKEESIFVDTSQSITHTSPLFHPSSYERGFITSAYAGIFLCTLGIVVNLLLFAILLSSRRLRFQFIYAQILNIALADLSYIVTVDSFTIYFELQAWRLGTAFCKTWMILDVALPSVSLSGLLLLNLDRIMFAYKTNLYQRLLHKQVLRISVLLCPWCINCVIVNFLWLGFPVETEEHLPGACVYGITKEANMASMWLTVFLPSLLIFVLLIFIFIAGIGEMPSVEYTSSTEQSVCVESSVAAHAVTNVRDQDTEHHVTTVHSRPARAPSVASIFQAGRQRRFVAALLAVDVMSLAITLPYSAYSQVSINCDSSTTCQSFVALFQILSWMKSSVTFVRPVFFILLTDIYLSIKRRLGRCFSGSSLNNRTLLNDSQQVMDGLLVPGRKKSYEGIILSQVNAGNYHNRNGETITSSVVVTSSPVPGQCKDLFDKQAQRPTTTNVYHKSMQDNKGTFL